MAQHTCWSCGTGYDGANCPVCILRKQSEKSADQATRDQERATAVTERALEEQTREITEALERANQAAEESAYETQMAIAHAAEEHKRTTADAWKLQSSSKSEQAKKFMDSGMLSEALDLALQAIRQDPSNLNGFAVASSVLNQQGKCDAARTYIEKQIQLLGHPEHRTDVENFRSILYKADSDDALRAAVCHAIEGNVYYWDRSDFRVDDRAESIAEKLSSWRQFKTALVVERWLLSKSGFTPARLTSARKLALAVAGDPAGAEPLRSELEELSRWISGEDKSGDSKMSKSAERRRPLAALALAEEICVLLGTNKRLISGFLRELNFADREKLEGDLGELRKLSAEGDFDADAFRRVQHEVAEKFAASQQVIQGQVYDNVKTTVDAKPRKTHGFLTGFVVWCILALLAGGRPNPTRVFGALLGAILFGMASKRVEKSFRYYRAMRDGLDHSLARTNQRSCELGLPIIPAPALRVHPPRLSIVVYAVLLCSYFGWWLHAIAPSSALNEGAIPNQGNVTESQVQPSSNSNANEQRIGIVSTVLPQQMQTITITGVGLGRKPAYLGDSDFLQVSDLTRDWNAGWSRDPGTDKVGLNVTSWTDTKIVIEGFTGAYGTDQNFLRVGDNIRFRVWNPQTREGPAIYASAVSGTATQNGGTLSSQTE